MLIALTGGIGSGKSTVAAEWVKLGATEVDADVLAREVVEPGTEGLVHVAREFGSEVLNPDGTLNRSELAKRAFADAESRKRLEAIMHPLIQKLALEKTRAIDGVVVYTIPLLAETRSPLKFDRVVTISCPEPVRIKRLIERGLSEDDARRRIKAQASDAEREERADIVISSDCEMSELLARARRVYQEING
jgi:dephospho-CoA kinase